MGDFTLGCLLGQYDRAQSFDVASVAGPLPAGAVNSWELGTTVGSFAFADSNLYAGLTSVHSSGRALIIDVASRGIAQGILTYNYQQPNDAFARWFPDVATHAMRVDFWSGIYNNGARFSQDFNGGTGVTIDQVQIMAPFRNAYAAVVSGDSTLVRFISGAAASEARIVLDDVLAQIDPITLHPEYEFQAAERAIRQHHRTLGGQLHTYTWDKYGAWNMPLRYLPTSHADLLNWWWQQGLNLCFTLDTSDSESIHLCRIVNERQPIGGRERPYADLWQGTLQLEAINRGNLDF